MSSFTQKVREKTNANLLFREIYEKMFIRKDLQKQKTQLAELLPLSLPGL